VIVLLETRQLHALRAGGIGERHPTNRRRINTNPHLAFPSVGRDGTRIAFVAKRSEPGQNGTKDRVRYGYLDGFSRFNSEGPDATLAGVPFELKSPLLA
jgi:hypothetical protein